MKMVNLLKMKLYKKRIVLSVALIGIAFILNGCGFRINIGNLKEDDKKNIVTTQQSEIDYNKDELLPLGTVVLLKDSNIQLMITGRMRKLEGNSSGEIWDYSGCAYPRGFMSSNDSYLFNFNEIDKVYFKGYQDEDEIKYNKQLVEYRNKSKGIEITNADNLIVSNDVTENIQWSDEELLPLGSIVTFKGTNKKVIIIGRIEHLKGDTSDDIYDYAACVYPEGSVSADSNYLFDGNLINKVYFKGYQDDQEIEYNKKLIEYRKSLREE
ncbi:DUF4176 domain-containing protein [Clostridium sp. ZBS15]|uniref:DUF4176 domain-containing protein n=2 Tax=unclassified Clostridium TaxID=2614128 RepID=UPI00207A7EFE|nr:DUF4176 domain-containing protein [Clostridium sp. ZBS15]